jgi:hypothetical protein
MPLPDALNAHICICARFAKLATILTQISAHYAQIQSPTAFNAVQLQVARYAWMDFFSNMEFNASHVPRDVLPAILIAVDNVFQL